MNGGKQKERENHANLQKGAPNPPPLLLQHSSPPFEVKAAVPQLSELCFSHKHLFFLLFYTEDIHVLLGSIFNLKNLVCIRTQDTSAWRMNDLKGTLGSCSRTPVPSAMAGPCCGGSQPGSHSTGILQNPQPKPSSAPIATEIPINLPSHPSNCN